MAKPSDGPSGYKKASFFPRMVSVAAMDQDGIVKVVLSDSRVIQANRYLGGTPSVAPRLPRKAGQQQYSYVKLRGKAIQISQYIIDFALSIRISDIGRASEQLKAINYY